MFSIYLSFVLIFVVCWAIFILVMHDEHLIAGVVAALAISFVIYKISGSLSTTHFTARVDKIETRLVSSGGKDPSISEEYYVYIKHQPGNLGETLISKDNYWQGKFNNADLVLSLTEGQTYNFSVSGYGKGWFNDYRNILTSEPYTERSSGQHSKIRYEFPPPVDIK